MSGLRSLLIAGTSAFALVLSMVFVPQAQAEEPAAWAQAHLDEFFTLYKHFHTHPELSLSEKETAARVAEELRAVGATVTTGIGGHGVVAILENGPGPRVMLRTDLDALPVIENTGLVYASTVKTKDALGRETGVMHACGHDIHMTNLIAAARYMAAHKDRWRGTIMFLGQPAEERVIGAKAMLDDGLFTKFPKPDLAIALHCDATLAAGSVGHRPGYILANVDTIDVVVRGRGGHGAFPHTTIDPVVVAAHLIVDLQSIVAREVKAGQPAVITVGTIHGGTKNNIIGDSCKLELTVRSYSPEVRKQLLEGIRRKADAAAASAGAPKPTVEVIEGTPATFNDADLNAKLAATFRRVLGDAKVVDVEASMGGEDFGLFHLAGVPSCMFRLGTVDKLRMSGYERLQQQPPSLHSALYYPDAEQTLATGITATCAALLDLMPAGGGKNVPTGKTEPAPKTLR
ncbi:MAG: amidohydrolase [Planctomycetia bacterium]|nr:amidohydrolase [Planctomycetia bacterium]